MASADPPVIRGTVPHRADFHDYREPLRHDFWYSCAYCTLAESEAKAIGFEIDHYLPRSLRPDLLTSYTNLFWSCEPCNQQKGDYPSESGPIKPEYYIVRPDQEHPGTHFELREDELYPRTQTGKFNIEWLMLNRLALRKLRGVRERLWKAREICAFGIQQLRSVSIDRITPGKRGQFLRMRREMSADYQGLQKALDQYIRERTRSPFLDPDPKHKSRLKKRRAYLRDERVIGPE